MGFSIAQYADLRPTLWHLTHRQNLDLIRESRFLKAAELLTSANLDSPRRTRQVIPGIPVVRDQKPLCENCMALQGDLSFADWLRELNRRVFFWPGAWAGPTRSGRGADYYCESDVL